MLIFKDKISGDEMLTDALPIAYEEDGEIIKVTGKMTTETTNIDESTFGGNKSAEGADEDEGAEASSVSGINVIVSNRLVETGFSKKKEFQVYIKEYMGKLADKLKEEGKSDDDIGKFKKGATNFVKKVLGEFSEYQFFMGESMDNEASMAYVKWDGETPYVYYIKASLDEEKV